MSGLQVFLFVGLALGLANGFPFPQDQERIEQQAEIVPSDTKLKSEPSEGGGSGRGFKTILIRPISLDFSQLFPSRRDPFFPSFSFGRRPSVTRDQAPAFGSPDFVNVPAETDAEQVPEKSPPRIPAHEPSSFSVHKLLEDTLRLQQDMMQAFFGPAPSLGKVPAELDPTDPAFDEEQFDASFASDNTPEATTGSRRPGGIFEHLFGGGFPNIRDYLPSPASNNGGSGGFPGFGNIFPPISDLPPDYDNSTYQEKEIDGQLVRVNETIKKQTGPHGGFVFHSKVYSVGPNGEVIEVEQRPEQIPEQTPEQTPERTPEQTPERFPEQLPEQIPEDIPIQQIPTDLPENPNIGVGNEPEREIPVVKEDFGPIVTNGRGVDEQIRERNPERFDERFNEV